MYCKQAGAGCEALQNSRREWDKNFFLKFKGQEKKARFCDRYHEPQAKLTCATGHSFTAGGGTVSYFVTQDHKNKD
ncbi:hypothetical protein GCM10008940_07250 [Microbulbifer agarilyticus]